MALSLPRESMGPAREDRCWQQVRKMRWQVWHCDPLIATPYRVQRTAPCEILYHPSLPKVHCKTCTHSQCYSQSGQETIHSNFASFFSLLIYLFPSRSTLWRNGFRDSSREIFPWNEMFFLFFFCETKNRLLRLASRVKLMTGTRSNLCR